jgi:Family of unknown function (DUF5989)
MINKKAERELEQFDAEAMAGSRNISMEIWFFIKKNKKWWLVPIIVVLGIFSILVFLSATGAAPFIYTLF